VGGNYTYSKLRGNIEGETTGSGPVTFGGLSVSYPEFQNFNQNAPVGFLQADQRHKVRLYGNWGLATPVGRFDIGVIERYDSGSPFSASASIPITGAMLCANAATNATCTNGSGTPTPIYPNGSPRNPAHDYGNTPTSVTYFFSDRGAFRWDDVIATDLAVNYEIPIKMVGLFVKGEVRNVFNHLAVTGGNTTVLTATNSANLAPFNPFTTKPVQCPTGTALTDCKAMGANYQFSTAFGKTNGTPTTFTQNGNYQLPRTYLFSAGVRF
jgi:hypothetical protein